MVGSGGGRWGGLAMAVVVDGGATVMVSGVDGSGLVALTHHQISA